ncbi:MAG: hypothetical protein II778_05275, partial [Anaerovibrio sp.]|nr:hypothetical protein [Anaerovibrio sp.]
GILPIEYWLIVRGAVDRYPLRVLPWDVPFLRFAQCHINLAVGFDEGTTVEKLPSETSQRHK